MRSEILTCVSRRHINKPSPFLVCITGPAVLAIELPELSGTRAPRRVTELAEKRPSRRQQGFTREACRTPKDRGTGQNERCWEWLKTATAVRQRDLGSDPNLVWNSLCVGNHGSLSTGKSCSRVREFPPTPLFCLFRMLPTRSRFSLLTPLCSLLVLKFQSPLQQKWRSGAGEQNHGGVFCIFPRHASGTSIIYLGLINFIRPLIHLSGPHEVCEIILTGHSVGCNRIGVRVQG